MSSKPEHDNDGTDEQHETSADTDPRSQSGESDEYERAPRDFKSDIDVEATQVPDHPVMVYPKVRGETKEASAYLVTQGDIADYVEDAPDDADAQDFGIEAIVELLNEKYESPEFDLSVEDYRNSPAGFYDSFFNAIVPEMGN
jgi:hypothetical protein